MLAGGSNYKSPQEPLDVSDIVVTTRDGFASWLRGFVPIEIILPVDLASKRLKLSRGSHKHVRDSTSFPFHCAWIST